MTKNLLLLLACTVITAGTFAQATSGYCGGEGDGTNLTWNFDASTGTLTISGMGEMEDFYALRIDYSSDYSSLDYYPITPWFDYASQIIQVEMGYGVESIGDWAFAGCVNLISIIIPESVARIGDCAFLDCKSLTSITIPNSVINIGGYAFEGCTGLTSITIPDGVTSLEIEVFEGCTGLTSITIGNSVRSIEFYAFSSCVGLSSITIPKSVTSIDNGAFTYCTSLTSIEVEKTNPSYLSENGVLFNKGKTMLCCYPAGKTGSSYTIPSSVTTIGDYAFDSCEGLTSVTIPNSVTTIGNRALSFCTSLTSITIPNSVKYIGSAAFIGCTNLTSITIPNGVTYIGRQVFSNCTKFSSITIPNSVTSIEMMAFYNCTSLTSITIPTSVTTIGWQAFYGCTNLTSISCCALEPPTAVVGGLTFEYINKSTCVLYVPVGGKVKYQAADEWKGFFKIEEKDFISTEPDALVAAITVYPNPAQDYLYINGIETKTPITIADISGKIVLQSVVAPNEAVSVAHLPKGVYMVQVAGKAVKIVVND